MLFLLLIVAACTPSRTTAPECALPLLASGTLARRVLAPPGCGVLRVGSVSLPSLCSSFLPELVGHERPRPSVLAHRGLLFVR